MWLAIFTPEHVTKMVEQEATHAPPTDCSTSIPASIDSSWAKAIAADDVGQGAEFRDRMLTAMGQVCRQYGGPQAHLLSEYCTEAAQQDPVKF